MRWHTGNVEPELEKSNSHCIIKLKDINEYKFVKWYLSTHHFYDDKNTYYSIDEIEKWCYGEEYRDLVGLNELQLIKEKLTKRIIYLDGLKNE